MECSVDPGSFNVEIVELAVDSFVTPCEIQTYHAFSYVFITCWRSTGLRWSSMWKVTTHSITIPQSLRQKNQYVEAILSYRGRLFVIHTVICLSMVSVWSWHSVLLGTGVLFCLVLVLCSVLGPGALFCLLLALCSGWSFSICILHFVSCTEPILASPFPCLCILWQIGNCPFPFRLVTLSRTNASPVSFPS